MPKTRSRKSPPVVGWREWVRLPDLGVGPIKAKLDTGARSSSLHAFDLEIFTRNDREWVRFVVHPLQRDSTETVQVEAELIDYRSVRNSGGQSELRPVIRTTLELGDRKWPIELTLTRRDEMGFRLLLGRQAIRRKYAVDPSTSFRTWKPEPKPKKKVKRSTRSRTAPAKRTVPGTRGGGNAA